MDRNRFRELVTMLRRAGVPGRSIALLTGYSYASLRVVLSTDAAHYPPAAPADDRRRAVMRALVAATCGGPKLSTEDAIFLVCDVDHRDDVQPTAARLLRQRLIEGDDLAPLFLLLDHRTPTEDSARLAA